MKFKLKSLLSVIALILALALSFTSCDIILSEYDIINSDGLNNGTENEGDTDTGSSGGTSGNTTGSGSGTSGDAVEDSSDSSNKIIDTGYLEAFDYNAIPAYSGSEYVTVNNNTPFFEENELVTTSYETYGALDSLGRCTVTIACIGRDIMPKDGEERGSISSVKPTGWIQAQYSCVNGGNLYNRSHLIGWQLTAENANRENLITGTRYMNEAMIPFESMVADYIKETENHVMYRVTPIFVGDNLLAAGVLMEAYSVEDEGEGISFNVFLYNVQPGVVLNYATGESQLENAESGDGTETGTYDYILNTKNKKIHAADCGNATTIGASNRQEYSGDIQDLLDEGYTRAGCCNPS